MTIIFSKPHYPFGNETLTPFPLVRKTANMHDFFHYKRLMGYEYDCLDANGCGAEGRSFDFLPRAAGAAALLIGNKSTAKCSNFYLHRYYFQEFMYAVFHLTFMSTSMKTGEINHVLV